MRKLLSVIVLCLVTTVLHGQEQALLTQFFYNKLTYNSAFSGAVPGAELTAVAREQWMGLEGSPSIQAVQLNLPLIPNRVGIGAVIRREKVGLTENFTANLSYAYHIRYGDYLIGLGVNAMLGNLSNDFSEQSIRTTQPFGNDPVLQGNIETATYFNAGASILMRSDRFYIGFSMPTLVENHIAFSDDDEILDGLRARYWHLMGGYSIPIGAHFLLNPQFNLSYSDDVPSRLDLSILLDIGDDFITGLGYRTFSGEESVFGESFNILGGVKISENWFMTISYDLGLTSLRKHNSGSIEVSMTVYFGDRGSVGEYRSPRFF